MGAAQPAPDRHRRPRRRDAVAEVDRLHPALRRAGDVHRAADDRAESARNPRVRPDDARRVHRRRRRVRRRSRASGRRSRAERAQLPVGRIAARGARTRARPAASAPRRQQRGRLEPRTERAVRGRRGTAAPRDPPPLHEPRAVHARDGDHHAPGDRGPRRADDPAGGLRALEARHPGRPRDHHARRREARARRSRRMGLGVRAAHRRRGHPVDVLRSADRARSRRRLAQRRESRGGRVRRRRRRTLASGRRAARHRRRQTRWRSARSPT